MSERQFRRASPRDPCPICGRVAACSQAPSGARFCWGKCASVAGWRHCKILDNGFSLFYPDDGADGDGRASSHAKREAKHADDGRASPEALAGMMAKCGSGKADHKFLGDQLGIHHAGIARIGAGRVVAEGKSQGYWLLPERDEHGTLIGLNRRFDDGSKMAVKGSRRGLTYALASAEREEADVVLIVEGHSDTAAALSVGLRAVGRPNNLGGSAMLAPLLQFAAQRLGTRVIVLGENDRKDNGHWPGREGADKVSRVLADAWGVRTWTAYPPEGVKDLRQWVKRLLPHYSGKTADERAAVGRAILQEIEDSAGDVEPDPDAGRLPALELPEVQEYSALVEDTIAAGTAGMPCPCHSIPLLQKRGTNNFLALMARCKRWTCPVCVHARRSAWLTHLIRCFEGVPAFHATEADDAAWKGLRKAVSRAGLDYVRIRTRSGPPLVILSGAVRGSRPVTRFEAADLIARALLDVNPSAARSVSASAGWGSHRGKEPGGEYQRRGQGPKGGFGVVTQRLRRQGVEPDIDHESETGRARWSFPDEWDEEQVEHALEILQAERHPTERANMNDEF